MLLWDTLFFSRYFLVDFNVKYFKLQCEANTGLWNMNRVFFYCAGRSLRKVEKRDWKLPDLSHITPALCCLDSSIKLNPSLSCLKWQYLAIQFWIFRAPETLNLTSHELWFFLSFSFRISAFIRPSIRSTEKHEKKVFLECCVTTTIVPGHLTPLKTCQTTRAWYFTETQYKTLLIASSGVWYPRWQNSAALFAV